LVPEVDGTLTGEDGLVVMAGVELVEWYQIYQTHGFHEPKGVLAGSKKWSTWNQKGFFYGNIRRTLLEPFYLRVFHI
jgi:hypothetical protein